MVCGIYYFEIECERGRRLNVTVTECGVNFVCYFPAGKPPSREAVVEWFRTQELPRGVGLDDNGKPADWFHGLHFYYYYSNYETGSWKQLIGTCICCSLVKYSLYC